jgi:hypothetical protein
MAGRREQVLAFERHSQGIWYLTGRVTDLSLPSSYQMTFLQPSRGSVLFSGALSRLGRRGQSAAARPDSDCTHCCSCPIEHRCEVFRALFLANESEYLLTHVNRPVLMSLLRGLQRFCGVP